MTIFRLFWLDYEKPVTSEDYNLNRKPENLKHTKIFNIF